MTTRAGLIRVLVLAGAVFQAGPLRVRAVELGIEGTRFTLDGKPTFLLGKSAYAMLGEPDDRRDRDLDELARRGFRWIRVWATWHAFDHDISAVEPDGRPRSPYLEKLKALVAACDRRGLVVDVTLSRGNGVTGPPRLQSHDEHRRAVETLVTALRPYRNWYLDLSNERNIRDKRHTSLSELKDLRALVRSLDPKRLVTASHAGDIPESDLRAYLLDIGLDFVSPHRPRQPSSPGQTEARTRADLAAMKRLGRVVPIHDQEPFRRGFGKWEPDKDSYLTDLQGALDGGAAGWCLHDGDTRSARDGRPRRSFDLREHGLFDGLDPVERAVADALPDLVRRARP